MRDVARISITLLWWPIFRHICILRSYFFHSIWTAIGIRVGKGTGTRRIFHGAGIRRGKFTGEFSRWGNSGAERELTCALSLNLTVFSTCYISLYDKWAQFLFVLIILYTRTILYFINELKAFIYPVCLFYKYK